MLHPSTTDWLSSSLAELGACRPAGRCSVAAEDPRQTDNRKRSDEAAASFVIMGLYGAGM